MFVFGADVPLVELMIGAAAVMILLLIEIIVVMILQMRQLNIQKKLAKRNGEIVKLMWEIKDKELKLRQTKK